MGFRSYIFAIGLVIAGCVVCAMGGQKVLVSLKNSSPTTMKYSDWAASDSDAEWLELTDVYVDWSASARIDTEHKRKGITTHTTKEYFVAGWCSTEDEAPARCFFVVEDPAKQKLMEDVWAAEEREDADWFMANKGRLVETRAIKGLRRTGFDLSSEDEKILRGLGHVAPKFHIIDMDAEPSGGMGMLMLLGGVALIGVGGVLGVVQYRGSKKKGYVAGAAPYVAGAPRPPLPGMRPGTPHPMPGRPYPQQMPGQPGAAPYPPAPKPPAPRPPAVRRPAPGQHRNNPPTT